MRVILCTFDKKMYEMTPMFDKKIFQEAINSCFTWDEKCVDHILKTL